MKTKKVMVAALGTALVLFGQANAGGKELAKHQVPKAVLDAFEKAHPGAKGVKFEQEALEGKTAYEVEYKESGREYDFLYGADGTLLRKEEEIDAKALPETVVQAVMKAHPKARIEEAEKVMQPDGTVSGYEVEIKVGGKELELELDTSGKILTTERD